VLRSTNYSTIWPESVKVFCLPSKLHRSSNFIIIHWFMLHPACSSSKRNNKWKQSYFVCFFIQYSFSLSISTNYYVAVYGHLETKTADFRQLLYLLEFYNLLAFAALILQLFHSGSVPCSESNQRWNKCRLGKPTSALLLSANCRLHYYLHNLIHNTVPQTVVWHNLMPLYLRMIGQRKERIHKRGLPKTIFPDSVKHADKPII